MNPTARVTVKTAWLPDFAFDLSGDGGAPPSSEKPWLVRVLQPYVRAELPIVGPITYRPAGTPGPTRWPLLAAGAVVVVGGVLFLAYLGARSLAR